MTKLHALFFLLVILISKVVSQDLSENIQPLHINLANSIHSGNSFEFEVTASMNQLKNDIENVDETVIRKHKLGIDISKRLYLLETAYVFYSEAAPGSFSGKKIVQKPIIYNSIFQIEKDLKKKVRSNEIKKEEAALSLGRYVEYAIVLLPEDTSTFEKELKESKSVNTIISMFDKIKIK